MILVANLGDFWSKYIIDKEEKRTCKNLDPVTDLDRLCLHEFPMYLGI